MHSGSCPKTETVQLNIGCTNIYSVYVCSIRFRCVDSKDIIILITFCDTCNTGISFAVSGQTASFLLCLGQ